jgi:hypothetical protein
MQAYHARQQLRQCACPTKDHMCSNVDACGQGAFGQWVSLAWIALSMSDSLQLSRAVDHTYQHKSTSEPFSSLANDSMVTCDV